MRGLKRHMVLMVHRLLQWLGNSPQSRNSNQEGKIVGKGRKVAPLWHYRTPQIQHHQSPPNQLNIPPSWKFGQYTPLNAPHVQILMQVKGQLLEARRLRMWSMKHNPNKYYLYHQDHGHDMEECIQLQDKIKEFIRHDWLDRFLKNRRERRDT